MFQQKHEFVEEMKDATTPARIRNDANCGPGGLLCRIPIDVPHPGAIGGQLLYSWRTLETVTNVTEVLQGYKTLRSHPRVRAATNAEVAYAGDLVLYCDEFCCRRL